MAGNFRATGTWMVHKNGKPNTMMKLIFDSKGKFKFAGSGYSSAGNYTVSGNTIKLAWTHVDGQKVKLGQMKKTLVVDEDNTFTIDNYTYAKYR
jgi:hypothetical protein